QKHIGGSILRSKSICNVRLSDLLLAPVRLVHLAPLTVHRVGSAHRKEPDSANGESQCPRQMKDVGANRAKPCVGVCGIGVQAREILVVAVHEVQPLVVCDQVLVESVQEVCVTLPDAEVSGLKDHLTVGLEGMVDNVERLL